MLFYALLELWFFVAVYRATKERNDENGKDDLFK